jgi:hypothetical protein
MNSLFIVMARESGPSSTPQRRGDALTSPRQDYWIARLRGR